MTTRELLLKLIKFQVFHYFMASTGTCQIFNELKQIQNFLHHHHRTAINRPEYCQGFFAAVAKVAIKYGNY